MSVFASRVFPAILWPLSTAIALGLFFLHPSAIGALEHWLFDSLSRTARPPATGGQVLIVEIDDAALAQFGRWPWPRRQTAALVDSINAAAPSAIALGITFPEPSDGDDALAKSIAAGPVVGGFSFEFDRSVAPVPGCVQRPLPAVLATVSAGPGASPFFEAGYATCDVPPIAGRLAGAGFLNATPDSDGVFRRVPLFISHAGSLYPSLALAAVMMAQPVRQLALRRTAADLLDLRLNDHAFTLDARASLLPEFRPPAGFQRISAAALLSGRADPAALRGRLVFVSVTATGIGDVRVTAVDPAYPGVNVHASVAGSLLRGSALAPMEAGRNWEVALILLVGLGSAAIVYTFPLLRALFALLILGVTIAACTSFALNRAGVFISPLLPLTAIAGNVVTATVRHVRAQSEKSRRAGMELRVANEFMLAALASLNALRDDDCGGHVVRVQNSLRLLCDTASANPRFSLPAETVELLVSVAPIHDIGKVGIPDAILRKPGRLTPEETELIRRHVHYGRQVLESARDKSGLDSPAIFDMCTALVYSHHERWDGTGYPLGLKGDAIPLPARMLALVDVYDALVTRRSYKPALPHNLAVREISAGRGTHFDPDIVDVFLAHHERFRRAYLEYLHNDRAYGAGD